MSLKFLNQKLCLEFCQEEPPAPLWHMEAKFQTSLWPCFLLLCFRYFHLMYYLKKIIFIWKQVKQKYTSLSAGKYSITVTKMSKLYQKNNILNEYYMILFCP